jgi:membrane AbrB-like protein
MRSFLLEFRDGLRALAPSRFPYVRFTAALTLGTAGGWTFAQLNLPLPWMLGAMTACTLGALVRAPVAAPAVVRPPMTMVIGVLLGAGFSPAIVAQLPTWIPTVLGLAGFVAACAAACVTYFRVVGGFDRTTAFFAGMPGGLVEMTVLGDEKGGDARIIALVHSARILLIVFTLPFIVQWIQGTWLGSRSQLGVSILDAPWTSDLWLIGAGILGVITGHYLRLPAKNLLGPMVVSAAIHVLGLSDFTPPREIVNAAQTGLGTVIGCRFLGAARREILRILGLSVGATVILLAITLAFAVLVSRIAPHGVVPLLLAYSPGGLAEMSLVALALQIEVAFVAAHHIIRILFVMVSAGPVFGLTKAES